MSLGLVASLSCLVLEASRGRNESEALGVPTEYYQRGRIVVIPTLGAPVGVGDVLWASNGRVARWGRLREIQLDGLSVPRVDSAVEAGLKLEFAVPRNSALYVWRTPDAEFVEPRPASSATAARWPRSPLTRAGTQRPALNAESVGRAAAPCI